MSLVESLTTPAKREQVVTDCIHLIDDEVGRKGGLSGMAIKGAYKLVKTVKPGFIRDVVDHMLDDWVERLDPFYEEWRKNGGGEPLGEYLGHRGSEVAERLLEVTDDRARKAKNASVKKMYEKMRPSAKKHVEEAVPRLGALIERHTQ